MAGNLVITCPECEKKFKPKADVQGKKIKCPLCAHPFVVPAAKNAKAGKDKPDPKKNAPAKAEERSKAAAPVVQAAPEETKADPNSDLDADPNPYGVKNVELVPRCPNCTAEMANEHAIICLECGYNTLTREWGKTEKTIGITFGQHLVYLLPALGSAAFVLFSILFLIYYAVVSPYHVDKTMMSFSDHESLRMWTTVIFLAWTWGAGIFCFKKFIEKPKPDEVVVD